MGLKQRILGISVVPLLALALLSGFILFQNVNDLRNSQDVQKTARVATAVGQLVHELQAERGLSVLAVAEGRVDEKLQNQRLKVDAAARGLETGARHLPEGVTIGGVTEGLVEIARLRQAVDTRSLRQPELTSAYSAVVRNALDDLDAMARLAGSVDPELDQTFEVYSAVLIGKELSGRERATVAGLLATGSVSPAGMGIVAALQAGQADAFHNITINAAPASLERWTAFISSPGNKNLQALRDTLSQSVGEPAPITTGDWFDSASARMDGLRAYETSLVEDVAGKAQSLVEREILTLTLMALGVLLIFGLTLGVCLKMSRAITDPLVDLTDDMRRLADGETDLELSGVARNDEIGAMTVAVVGFRDSLIARRKAEQELAESERRSAAVRRELEAEAAAAERKLVVDSVGLAMGRLAAGDLTYQVSDGLPEEYRKLQTDFNTAIAQLHEAMSAVVTSVSTIRVGSGEISQAADDLSRRTEQQAASLEETSAALDEITATVNRTASGTRQVFQTVQTAKSDAETSQSVVSDAVNAMGAIARSAQEISQIVGVIDEIAFQTNLLALNAGVEAARAGDAGRGFAVVAQEVRALAQRSAEAAKEIKGLISASTTQVNAGVNLVGQTGEALQRIIGRVIEIDGLVSEIAASAQEQATGLHEVNLAINQMDQVTQQNAAMVEQSTAASHSLTQEAETLAGAVSHFQIGSQTVGYAPTRASVIPAKAAAATVTRLKTTGRGGAARKPEHAVLADGWESF